MLVTLFFVDDSNCLHEFEEFHDIDTFLTEFDATFQLDDFKSNTDKLELMIVLPGQTTA